MKSQKKLLLKLVAAVLLSVVSCVNDPMESTRPDGQSSLVATSHEQVSAMKSSVVEIEAVMGALSELQGLEDSAVRFEDCVNSLKEHISLVESGLSGANASIASLKLQGRIAEATGALKVALAIADDDSLQKELSSMENSVASWLGKDFKNHFVVSSECARLCSMIAIVEQQVFSIDAIASDVEAGLRVGDASSLKSVLTSVRKNSESLSSLSQEMTSLGTEVEKCYTDAVKAATPAVRSALKTVNTKAVSLLAETGSTLSDLSDRIASCESKIDELESRLTQVEADVTELLGMIQSLSFVSEYSTETAIAYYSLSSSLDPDRASEGKMARVPNSSFNLNFLVRPAAAAAALAESSLWNEGVTVKGYYAQKISLASASYDFLDFNITGVSANENGLVTVTVENAFSDEFYFKETGAKVALSVVNGKTDVTSRFVEIVPKDASGKIYAESITLTPAALSIQNGDTYQLEAVVLPSDVTDKGCVWEDYDSEYLNVDSAGKLTATAVGESVVEVTANATDEFGRKLTAQCNVQVAPAVRIIGKGYVEVGNKITLSVESPNAIVAEDVEWKVMLNSSVDQAATYVTLTEDEQTGDAVVEGLKMLFNTDKKEYTTFEVVCTVGQSDPVELVHELKVVAVQPKGVQLRNGLPNDAKEASAKIGAGYSLAADILPNTVDKTLFRCRYTTNREDILSVGLSNENGWAETVGEGEATATIEVLSDSQYDYYYPAKTKFTRDITVHVEPYYVASLVLSAGTDEIDIDTPTQITATFTSDVAEKDPTYQDLTWESLDEEVATVTSDGVVTGKTEGTAIIRARTLAKATADGVPMEATCTLTVVEPGTPVIVGEYYFSDGTYGSKDTEENKNKTVVGVIFAKANVSAADPHLAAAGKTKCTHGLAIGLYEEDTNFATGSSYSINTPVNYLLGQGYPVTTQNKICGYGSTQGLMESESSVLNLSIDVVFVSEFYTSTYDLTISRASSGWYIPSYYEMTLIHSALSQVNSSLSAVQGELIDTSGLYWHSTFYHDGQFGYNYIKPFDMAAGEWDLIGDGELSNSDWNKHPVRVVIAF